MLIQQDLRAVPGRAARAGRRRRAAQPRGHRAGASAPGASPSATATARPRRRAGRQLARPAGAAAARWAGRCPGYAVALLDVDGARAAADEGEVCIDLARAPARADDGLPRRPPSARPRRCATASTTRATSPGATPTATSPTSAAPTTSSRRRDYRISPFELESVADRAPGGRRGRGRAEPRPAAPGGAEGLRRARAGPRAGRGDRARDPRLHAASASRRTSASAGIEFAELPKTISGKIRRVELREAERRARPRPPATPPSGGRNLA